MQQCSLATELFIPSIYENSISWQSISISSIPFRADAFTTSQYEL